MKLKTHIRNFATALMAPAALCLVLLIGSRKFTHKLLGSLLIVIMYIPYLIGMILDHVATWLLP